ncbi:MAG: hypothetical protein V5A33_02535 [Halobacteriales archaeon]
MTAVERSFRGISVRLAAEYLRGLGGRVTNQDGVGPDQPIAPDDLSEPVVVQGEGWQARLTSETVDIGPSLSLTEVSVTFERDGADETDGTDGTDGTGRTDADSTDLDDLVERFARKAVRAGG